MFFCAHFCRSESKFLLLLIFAQKVYPKREFSVLKMLETFLLANFIIFCEIILNISKTTAHLFKNGAHFLTMGCSFFGGQNPELKKKKLSCKEIIIFVCSFSVFEASHL